jgi:hypothetical protein
VKARQRGSGRGNWQMGCRHLLPQITSTRAFLPASKERQNPAIPRPELEAVAMPRSDRGVFEKVLRYQIHPMKLDAEIEVVRS